MSSESCVNFLAVLFLHCWALPANGDCKFLIDFCYKMSHSLRAIAHVTRIEGETTMEISRRGFLESGALVAAASATVGLAGIATASTDTSAGTSKLDVIARLSFQDAKYLVGSHFVVRSASGDTTLTCVEVSAVGPESSDSPQRNQAFVMKFQTQNPGRLKEGTYNFEHSFLGRFRLFVTPTNDGSNAKSYTAVINHQTR